MIDHKHPAVEAATFAQWSAQRSSHWCLYAEVSDVVKKRWRKGSAKALNAALPHLAAEDLRNTPAGRALMAEGWDALVESMSASGEFHDVDRAAFERINPFRMEASE